VGDSVDLLPWTPRSFWEFALSSAAAARPGQEHTSEEAAYSMKLLLVMLAKQLLEQCWALRGVIGSKVHRRICTAAAWLRGRCCPVAPAGSDRTGLEHLGFVRSQREEVGQTGYLQAPAASSFLGLGRLERRCCSFLLPDRAAYALPAHSSSHQFLLSRTLHCCGRTELGVGRGAGRHASRERTGAAGKKRCSCLAPASKALSEAGSHLVLLLQGKPPFVTRQHFPLQQTQQTL
jgi:hypothetical protein